jgi:nucleotide-binding universal stress UspA family protein
MSSFLGTESRPSRLRENLSESRPTIIVPLDGTPRSAVALPVAKALADLEGGTLHVVHVAKRRLPPRETARALGLSPRELFGTVIDELQGSPAAAIVRLAREAEDPRIVMCARSRKDKPRAQIGTVAEQVLSGAECPVVLVQPEWGFEPWAPRRILLPHDGSPATASALGPAMDLAERATAALMVLHVAAWATKPPSGAVTIPAYVDQPQHEWPEWSREFLETLEFFCNFPEHARPRLFVSTGDPGQEIVKFIAERGIDLVALAWNGTLQPERAETIKEVLIGSSCPIMFLRTGARPPMARERQTTGPHEREAVASYLS